MSAKLILLFAMIVVAHCRVKRKSLLFVLTLLFFDIVIFYRKKKKAARYHWLWNSSELPHHVKVFVLLPCVLFGSVGHKRKKNRAKMVQSIVKAFWGNKIPDNPVERF